MFDHSFTYSIRYFSEINQILIVSRGGARILADTASRIDDPQTLRMVAGAIANLCGTGKVKDLKVFLQ